MWNFFRLVSFLNSISTDLSIKFEIKISKSSGIFQNIVCYFKHFFAVMIAMLQLSERSDKLCYEIVRKKSPSYLKKNFALIMLYKLSMRFWVNEVMLNLFLLDILRFIWFLPKHNDVNIKNSRYYKPDKNESSRSKIYVWL